MKECLTIYFLGALACGLLFSPTLEYGDWDLEEWCTFIVLYPITLPVFGITYIYKGIKKLIGRL